MPIIPDPTEGREAETESLEASESVSLVYPAVNNKETLSQARWKSRTNTQNCPLTHMSCRGHIHTHTHVYKCTYVLKHVHVHKQACTERLKINKTTFYTMIAN